MSGIRKFFNLIDNYVLARLSHRPSPAAFWYLPEPLWEKKTTPLSHHIPLYPIDYRKKLKYTLENSEGIIVLPYHAPIGQKINPEAAFQYALGLHDSYMVSGDRRNLEKFFHYAEY